MRIRLFALAAGLATLAGLNQSAAADAYTFGYSPFGVQQLIINGTAIDAYSTGWYDQTGFHSSGNTNYVAGSYQGTSWHDYFAFDLSGISGPITSAILSIGQPLGGYSGPASGLTYTNYDVTTDTGTLTATQSGATGIYADLGSGVSYGSTLVDYSSAGTQVNIMLDDAALAAITAAEGSTFALGGSLNVGAVPLPASAPMFGTALLALGVVGYGLRRRKGAATA